MSTQFPEFVRPTSTTITHKSSSMVAINDNNSANSTISSMAVRTSNLVVQNIKNRQVGRSFETGTSQIIKPLQDEQRNQLTAQITSQNIFNNVFSSTTSPQLSTVQKTLPKVSQNFTEFIQQEHLSTSDTNDTTNVLISFMTPTTPNPTSISTFSQTSTTKSSDNYIFSNNQTSFLLPSSSPQLLTTTVTASMNSEYLNLTWASGCAVTIFLLIIFITVIGNTLVILSVLTTRRLRTVTNCFVMNLAVTDWLVGIFVMPPAVILYIVGSWKFGWILCDIWISLDVLLCTASILSLCAISLDRYLAVIQPLTYSKKRRSKRLAMFMIFIVWIVAFSITCPPFLGWYEPGRRQTEMVECRYNQNKGYVVFSAMGSFFIPLGVMLYVYLNIGFVLTSRRQRITLTEASEKSPETDADCENFLTESENIMQHCSVRNPMSLLHLNKYKIKSYDNDLLSVHYQSSPNNRRISSIVGGTIPNDSCSNLSDGINTTSLYELVEISRSPLSTLRCPTVTCKYPTAATIAPATERILTTNGKTNDNSMEKYFHHNEQIQSDNVHFNSTQYSNESNFSSTTSKSKQNHHHLNPIQPQQGQQVKNGKTNIQNNHHNHNYHLPYHRAPPMRISTQKRDTKTAKTLTIVMGGFIICWLPFFTYYILIPFLPRDSISEILMSFLTWVGWVNCAINPFIYAFYNPDFRTAFWRLTFRRICKKPTNHLTKFKG